MVGGFTSPGRPSELSAIKCLALALAFADDNIVPLASAALGEALVTVNTTTFNGASR